MDDVDDLEGLEDFSMDDLEKDLKKGRGGRRWLWFLIGTVFGVGGTIAAPIYLAPYLPAALSGNREILTGPVLAEERSEGRVLLTIQAEQGAFIASFSQRVEEIALLVDPGDVVTVAVSDYEPFIEDPDFEGVTKGKAPDKASEIDSDAEGDEAEGDVREGDAAEGDVREGDAVEGDVEEGDAVEGDVEEGDAAASAVADTVGSRGGGGV